MKNEEREIRVKEYEVGLSKSELILITEGLNDKRDVFMREKYTLNEAQKIFPKTEILNQLIEKLNVYIRKAPN